MDLSPKKSTFQESSKFGGRYPTEDPSATVSRPDSPVQNIIANRGCMNDRGHPLISGHPEHEDDGEADVGHQELRRLTDFHHATPPIASFSRAATATISGSPRPRLRLNSFNSPVNSLDDFNTVSAANTPQSVISDILTLRRPIKPDLIPSWESAAATAGGYATIRRPLVTGGRSNNAQATILSPAQKVLSDSEGEDSPVVKRFHQRDRFQTFVSPVGYAVLPTSAPAPLVRRGECGDDLLSNYRA